MESHEFRQKIAARNVELRRRSIMHRTLSTEINKNSKANYPTNIILEKEANHSISKTSQVMSVVRGNSPPFSYLNPVSSQQASSEKRQMEECNKRCIIDTYRCNMATRKVEMAQKAHRLTESERHNTQNKEHNSTPKKKINTIDPATYNHLLNCGDGKILLLSARCREEGQPESVVNPSLVSL
eukprot:Tbor_TRINITY_DN4700_c0_g1::TRINITY_DN4700_c0_g1_i1::g.17129::m.17129